MSIKGILHRCCLIAFTRLWVLLPMMLLTSCIRREFTLDYEPLTNVQISIDWQLSPEATAKGMTILFYDMNNPDADFVRYDFTDVNGGVVKLTPGTYRAIAYNNDTEAILYRNMQNIETLEAYTRSSSLEETATIQLSSLVSNTRANNEQVILEPDRLWCGASEVFTIKEDGTTSPIIIQPETRISVMSIQINGVANLQYLRQMGGTMSGLAPGVNMLTGQKIEGGVIQAFEVDVVDATTLSISFFTFGKTIDYEGTEVEELNNLTIYAMLADGSQWQYTVDVTELVSDEDITPDVPTDIHIEIDELPVPKPITNGSGFQPTIDGWDDVNIDVGMGNENDNNNG